MPAVSGKLFLNLLGVDASSLDMDIMAVVLMYAGMLVVAVLSAHLRLRRVRKGLA